MKHNFKTLCTCLALVMYAGTSVAMDGDWSDELTYNPWADEPSRSTPSAKNNKESKKENVQNKEKSSVQAGNSSQRVSKKNDSHSEKRKMPEEVLFKWMDAAKEGDIDTIRKYIDQNYDVNAKDFAGETALGYATWKRHKDVVELLLEHGPDVNVKDEDGKTALDYAKEKNNKEIVKYLEQANKKDVQSTSSQSQKKSTDFQEERRKMPEDVYIEWMKAVAEGNIDTIRSYINQNYEVDAHYNIASDIRGNRQRDVTALNVAVSSGFENIAKLLLENGADPNTYDNHEILFKIPLIEAVRSNKLEMVRMLLKHGAKISLVDRFGNTAVDYALGNIKTNEEIIKLLSIADNKLIDKYGRTALMRAASRKYLYAAPNDSRKRGDREEKYIKLLLTGNQIVDAQDNEGKTALMLAALHGHYRVAKLLIEEYKADVNIQDNNGYTALMLAAYNGREHIVKLLLENGAEVNVQNEDGNTALILAKYNNPYDSIITGLLKKYEADVNIRNKKGVSALNFENGTLPSEDAKSMTKEEIEQLRQAARKGDIETIKNYIKRGVNVDQVSPDFAKTALYVAAEEGHFDIVKLLVEHGADVNYCGEQGSVLCGAGFCAYKDENVKIIEFLLKNGADPNKHNQNCLSDFIPLATTFWARRTRRWPPDQAKIASANRLKVVKMLLKYGADINLCIRQLPVLTKALYCLDSRYNFNKEIIQFLLDKGAVMGGSMFEDQYTLPHFEWFFDRTELGLAPVQPSPANRPVFDANAI